MIGLPWEGRLGMFINSCDFYINLSVKVVVFALRSFEASIFIFNELKIVYYCSERTIKILRVFLWNKVLFSAKITWDNVGQ